MSDFRQIYTVGHSTRTVSEFADLLRVGSADLVVDIRSIPRSRTNPQFNLDVLPDSLGAWQVGYTYIPALGGLRKKSKTVPFNLNAYWTNQSFHNYADYAMSEEFHLGLSRLLELSQVHRCAIMCSEAVWWRCHRRIVTDYLIHRGSAVAHLMSPARADPAKLTPFAIEAGHSLAYPARSIS